MPQVLILSQNGIYYCVYTAYRYHLQGKHFFPTHSSLVNESCQRIMNGKGRLNFMLMLSVLQQRGAFCIECRASLRIHDGLVGQGFSKPNELDVIKYFRMINIEDFEVNLKKIKAFLNF